MFYISNLAQNYTTYFQLPELVRAFQPVDYQDKYLFSEHKQT